VDFIDNEIAKLGQKYRDYYMSLSFEYPRKDYLRDLNELEKNRKMLLDKFVRLDQKTLELTHSSNCKNLLINKSALPLIFNVSTGKRRRVLLGKNHKLNSICLDSEITNGKIQLSASILNWDEYKNFSFEAKI
jgi:hypothetical protein